MPLPAALAARLAKRGILSKKSAQQQSKPQEEEVFAESYDNDHEDNTNVKSIGNQIDSLEKIKFMGYPCCPNVSTDCFQLKSM